MSLNKPAKQAEIARLFGKSQAWVSIAQSRTVDPMPRDLDGAIAWGRRCGRLQDPAPAPDLLSAPVPAQTSANPQAPASNLELEELRLKGLRADRLQLEIDLRAGKLLRREDVEQRELVMAAEFRRIVCEYPLRARQVIERHVHDAAVIENIIAELAPLAAELMNKADPRHILKSKTQDEIRAALMARVEELMTCSR